MEKEYVSQMEFKNLSDRVEKLEAQSEKNETLLLEIDKKVDLIFEKIVNAGDKEDLKFKPINEKITNIEDNQKWIWRSIGGTIIGLLIKYWIG